MNACNVDELYHHGIKGMRWGVRRFQNSDGSLTPAGRKRYDVNIDKAKERVKSAKKEETKASIAYNKATAGGLVYNKKATDALIKASNKVRYTKELVGYEKAKQKLNSETGNKSKHRLKLEAEYKSKGMSDEEAAVAAYKRAKTEKIIAATAGVAVTAAAAYVAYKHYDKTVDKYIKAGTELQNISGRSNKGVSDAFYFSLTQGDNTKYRGIYGKSIKDLGKDVYETKIGVNSAMKVASEKSATKALSDLVSSDNNYRKELQKHLADSVDRHMLPSQNKVIKDGLNALQKGKVNSKVYNALNLTLTDHALDTSSSINSGFYNKLKSLGYDAIMDVNDKKFSGYRSSKPMIAFNAAGKAAVKSVREVGEEEIKKAYAKGMGDVLVKSLAPSVAGYAGVIGLINAGAKSADRRNNDSIVKEYKKKHPNTSLSYNQILDKYYGQ